MRKSAVLLNENDDILAMGTLESDEDKTGWFLIEDELIKQVYIVNSELHIRLMQPDSGIGLYAATLSAVRSKDHKLFFKGLRKVDRRLDVKIYVDYSSWVAPLDGKPGGFPVTVMNLSTGGVQFSAAADLDTEITHETIVPFTTPPLVLSFRILRKTQNSAGQYIYGCQFEALSEEEEKVLREYVYWVQRRQQRASIRREAKQEL